MDWMTWRQQMSTGRQKDQKDFDLEQIVKIMDQALESDDQRIKDALRALMTVTVLCTAEHPDQVLRHGPLSRMVEDLHNMAKRLSRLEDELNDVKMRMPTPRAEPYMPTTPAVPGIYPNPSTGPWIGTDLTRPTPMYGPSWTSAGDDPTYRGASGSSRLAEDFLKELTKNGN